MEVATDVTLTAESRLTLALAVMCVLLAVLGYALLARIRRLLGQVKELSEAAAEKDAMCQELLDGAGLPLRVEAFPRVRAATFALLDKAGLPVSAGFFVSPCGVALAAARDAGKCIRRRGRRLFALASMACSDVEVELEVVERKIGGLNVALLRRLPSASSLGPVPFLAIPAVPYDEGDLSGSPVNLVSSSVAWSRVGAMTRSIFPQGVGRIIASTDTAILYSEGSFARLGGSCLVLRHERVLAVHSEARPEDLDRIPRGDAEADRLDHPSVKAAVARLLESKPE